jgi:hypothetical protein
MAPRVFLAFLLIVLFGRTVLTHAQTDTPKLEAYGGFDYVRFNVNADVSGFPPSSSYNLFGGGGQIEYNATDRFGIVGGFAGVGSVGRGVAFSYLFGPRVNFRHDKVTVFGEGLLGGFLSSAGIGRLAVENNFALGVGGGVDYALSRYVAIRPVEAQYFLTTLPDGLNDRQNSFRFSTGVAIRLSK